MIFNLFRKPTAPEAVLAVYSSIVAQSRQPLFYAEWGVPDTVTGRFDMISLHLSLLLRRLKDDAVSRPFAQAVVELFFRDMDRSIRELGVSDIGVPRKIKMMGKAFYGLAIALGAALDENDSPSVEKVLVKNVLPDGNAKALADYLLAESAALAARPTAAIMAGTLTGAAA